MTDVIREVLSEYGRLGVDPGALEDEDDLYQVGLTSHASVDVMLALEDHFDIEFPSQMLRKSTFSSVASIRAVLSELGVDDGALALSSTEPE